jgi:SPX domain protein involved in polyphosphate accumulation
MKFGHYLERHMVIEWRDFYINYKILKAFLLQFEIRYKNNRKINFKF